MGMDFEKTHPLSRAPELILTLRLLPVQVDYDVKHLLYHLAIGELLIITKAQ